MTDTPETTTTPAPTMSAEHAPSIPAPAPSKPTTPEPEKPAAPAANETQATNMDTMNLLGQSQGTAALQEQLTALLKANESLNSTVSNLQAQVSSLQSQVETLTAENTKLKSQVATDQTTLANTNRYKDALADLVRAVRDSGGLAIVPIRPWRAGRELVEQSA